MEREKDNYRVSRVLYIIEAALEYFISMLVAGAYLAKVSAEIGISDGLIGILTSFVSLGCGFQLVAIFLANKTPVKHWVTILHIVNQVLFALIYVVPFFKISNELKIILFTCFLLLGHVINNIVNSPKINWFMSLVDDKKRGGFTATKEMVSLIGGIIFSFVIGAVIDRYDAAGNTYGAFIFCGIGIFILMVGHSLTLIFSREKPAKEDEKIETKRLIGELIKDRGLLKVILVSVLWSIAHYATTPFYGTYQIKELGFSMTFVSILSIAYAVFRSAFSKPLGEFADKHSFVSMLNICFIIEFIAFAVNIFTIPSNGKIMYSIYYILYAIGMAGINSGEINLIYDYVDKPKRIGALALKSTISGFAGFFTTLLVSLLVEHIQKNDNIFLGISVYAQQIVSLIGCIVVVILLLYINLVLKKKKSLEQ